MLSPNYTQDISYLWRQLDKTIIFLERPRIQWQLLAILGGLLLAFLLYPGLWYRLKNRFPQSLTLWQQDKPI